MSVLNIDLETYSSVDLKKCGVYAYTASPDFEILLFAYSLNNEPVQVVDIASGEKVPHEVMMMLEDPNVIKTAYNANFERTCIRKFFRIDTDPDQWRCTAVHAATLGLPPSLGEVARVFGLPDDKQKMGIGYSLIRYFCIPCKPTKINGGRTRNLPEHDPEKWKTFKEYCRQDVVTEQTIREKLMRFPVPADEQALWSLDQRINDRGIRVDRTLATKAIECDKQYGERLIEEAVKLTGLENPKSVAQIKKWLLDNEGEEVESLNKKSIPKLMEKVESDAAKRVLELRQEMAKTSTKKYEAMLRSILPDDRIKGILQFYGANRTGRWAGRLVQVHNLPQNKLPDLADVRDLVRTGRFDLVELLYDSVPYVLSQLIRTAFIPDASRRFIIADFSAIEARVIAWIAGEDWRMEVFRTHGKIYEASAAQMFHVPVESITKGNPLRQKGKIAELALGYQGGKGALITMGALDMGLDEEELPSLVNAWRSANQRIVKFWYVMEEAAIRAVRDKTRVPVCKGAEFSYESSILFMKLPSGRRLAYVRPKIERDERFGKDGLTYEGVDQDTKKWSRLKTYGGKLTENCVQAIARDCLAVSMLRLDKAGHEIVMHVHDETILNEPKERDTLQEVVEIMGLPIRWAPGLPLRADAFESEFYKKD